MASLMQRLRSFVGRIPRVQTLPVHGRSLRVPVLERKRLRNLDSYEPEVTAILRAALAVRSGTFVDIGVNLGQILAKVKAFEPERDYVGFEPSLFCCYYVEQLIAENGFENCAILARGLGDQAISRKLHFSSIADSSATMVDDFWVGKHRKTTASTVLIETGDASIDALGIEDIGIVKIDVEGGELEVLKGLKGTAARHKPLILAEVLPYVMGYAELDGEAQANAILKRDRSSELAQLLQGWGYDCFRMRSDGSLEQTWEFGMVKYDASMCNYVFVHATQAEMVEQLRTKYRKFRLS